MLSAIEVARRAGLPLKRSGDHWITNCPFPNHPDNDPSFAIFEKRYHCFGCNENGSPAKLYSLLFHVSEYEAWKVCGEEKHFYFKPTFNLRLEERKCSDWLGQEENAAIKLMHFYKESANLWRSRGIETLWDYYFSKYVSAQDQVNNLLALEEHPVQAYKQYKEGQKDHGDTV